MTAPRGSNRPGPAIERALREGDVDIARSPGLDGPWITAQQPLIEAHERGAASHTPRLHRLGAYGVASMKLYPVAPGSDMVRFRLKPAAAKSA